MKQDKVLKEKINSLDTLSTGIVFGKEEAWDKLQVRMDKPAKVISLKYWMAAAAILLLMVTIFLAFNNSIPVNEVVKSNTPQQILPVNNTVTTSLEQRPVTAEKNTPAITHKAIKRTTINEEKQSIQPKREEIQIVQAPAVEIPVTETTASVVNTPVATASKIPTKVVHINDLVNEPAGSEATMASNKPLFKIMNGQVIHLNDITDHQARVSNYLKQQKDFVVSIPLFNSSSEQTNTSTPSDENYTPLNVLKFKIN
ncbi:MAG: hypothetical protein K0Q79_3216 [Flavipsychrobacter sp.]|jgi:hypothetical protein|nr:hypothetical protein [Flavipsychrobacter sp.]